MNGRKKSTNKVVTIRAVLAFQKPCTWPVAAGTLKDPFNEIKNTHFENIVNATLTSRILNLPLNKLFMQGILFEHVTGKLSCVTLLRR